MTVTVVVAVGGGETVGRCRLPLVAPGQHAVALRVAVKRTDAVRLVAGLVVLVCSSVQRNRRAPQSRRGTAAGTPSDYVINVVVVVVNPAANVHNKPCIYIQ